MPRAQWILVWLGLGCAPTAGSAEAPGAAEDGGRHRGRREVARGDGMAAGCERLDALAACVRAGISALQREPVTGELPLFVTESTAAGVTSCDGVSADTVAWERSETGMSHYDDGRADIHIEYRFRVHECEPLSMQIDLSMGG